MGGEVGGGEGGRGVRGGVTKGGVTGGVNGYSSIMSQSSSKQLKKGALETEGNVGSTREKSAALVARS